jgi:NAD(P)-dependent dehydrogenase (short-subunit alcohol dehydrogenase family)
MLFENKIVWVTGGGSGIGEAMAMEFANQGAKVAVSGRRKERLDSVVATIGPERSLALPLDVTDEEAVHAAALKIQSHFGGLDVAVANAGYGVAGRIEKLTAEDWRRQFDVNVVGLTTTVRAALPLLRERGGRVALLGSVMSQLTMPGNGAYSSSKYAVRAIGQTLSMELAGSGVSCTTLHPGFVESEIGQVDNGGVFDEQRKDPRPQRFMWTSARAAKVCVQAISSRKREFVFTGHGRVAAFIGRHFPGLNHLVGARGGSKKLPKG